MPFEALRSLVRGTWGCGGGYARFSKSLLILAWIHAYTDESITSSDTMVVDNTALQLPQLRQSARGSVITHMNNIQLSRQAS